MVPFFKKSHTLNYTRCRSKPVQKLNVWLSNEYSWKKRRFSSSLQMQRVDVTRTNLEPWFHYFTFLVFFCLVCFGGNIWLGSVTPGSATKDLPLVNLVTIWDAGEWTWIDHIKDKLPILRTLLSLSGSFIVLLLPRFVHAFTPLLGSCHSYNFLHWLSLKGGAPKHFTIQRFSQFTTHAYAFLCQSQKWKWNNINI